MAAALVVTPAGKSNIRDDIAISGTGFQASTDVTVTIVSPEDVAELSWVIGSDLSGDWAFPGNYRPIKPGLITITADDGTDSLTEIRHIFT